MTFDPRDHPHAECVCGHQAASHEDGLGECCAGSCSSNCRAFTLAPVTIFVVFDGPPGPESGRFVEVETEGGKSIRAGEWIERPDGYWALRIDPFAFSVAALEA